MLGKNYFYNKIKFYTNFRQNIGLTTYSPLGIKKWGNGIKPEKSFPPKSKSNTALNTDSIFRILSTHKHVLFNPLKGDSSERIKAHGYLVFIRLVQETYS